jgi:hypothetical protein
VDSEWIKASLALRYVAKSRGKIGAAFAICRRAHLGTLATHADRLIVDDHVKADMRLPADFWWAEGHAALEQDWDSGDFSTWIDQRKHLRAFDVSFDFIELCSLVQAEDRTEALAGISVVGNPDWIAAREVARLMLGLDGVVDSLRTIVEHCSTGRLVARAHRMTKRGTLNDARIEWEVPLWFWRELSPSSPPYELWAMDKAFGAGNRNGERIEITLQGLHFHWAGLSALGIAKPTNPDVSTPSRSGRPPERFWEPMIAAIAGQIFRGDLNPKRQSEVESAMADWLENKRESASEASIRKRAKLLWDEWEG